MTSGLQVRDLCKSFGGLQVARSISFDLPPGARKALIGPNGAGKTTFANLLTGVLHPSRGTIRFDNVNVAHLSEAQRVKAGIAKTFQITRLFRHMTVRENLTLPILEREKRGGGWFGQPLKDRRLQQEVVALLEDFRLIDLIDVPVHSLAYGQQRLVEMALTLALQPKVLILDEPAAGVPEADAPLIVEAIERLPGDLSVLIIEHDMDLVFRVARQILVLVSGEILMEGTPAEIRSDARVRELYLGGAHV